MESLGSFSSTKLDYDHIIKQLAPEEFYEFENYIQSINFSKKNFHCQVEKLSRFLIKAAPDFAQSLIEI